ncbi:MAG TPA: hypothetical protein VGD10_04555 [Allosphingosinicella sp.]|uniref:hypothetical protein n=1 Tax=Allosphingosinicella sp. TaxID=2823234 RepID=UPI002ED90663
MLESRKLEQHDLNYWQERATSEMQLAQRAATMDIARPHYRLAMSYLEKVEELKRRLRWRQRAEA